MGEKQNGVEHIISNHRYYLEMISEITGKPVQQRDDQDTSGDEIEPRRKFHFNFVLLSLSLNVVYLLKKKREKK